MNVSSLGFFPTLGLVSFGMLVRSTVIAGSAALLFRTPRALARRVYRLGYAPHQLRREFPAAVRTVLFDALMVALINTTGIARFAPNTLSATLLTIGVMFVWVELWFYATHRLLHTKALYRFHAQHHVATVTEPLTSLSFSMVERVILIGGILGFAVASSHVLPITQAGLLIYFVINYTLNVIGHSNTEIFPAGYAKTIPGQFFISVSYHSMHHARYQGHYGLFTRTLDRLFHSEFPDYDQVQSRAAMKNGLKQLGERL